MQRHRRPQPRSLRARAVRPTQRPARHCATQPSTLPTQPTGSRGRASRSRRRAVQRSSGSHSGRGSRRSVLLLVGAGPAVPTSPVPPARSTGPARMDQGGVGSSSGSGCDSSLLARPRSAWLVRWAHFRPRRRQRHLQLGPGRSPCCREAAVATYQGLRVRGGGTGGNPGRKIAGWPYG